jgi:hypothetical protein
MNYHGYQDLVSDNKFLLFDRTSTGFTINNWIEGSKITITTRKKIPGMNYFLLFNRTATGYTKETIQEYIGAAADDFDDDILEETFGSPTIFKNVVVYSPVEGMWTWKSAE